jgi:hypothetical protein
MVRSMPQRRRPNLSLDGRAAGRRAVLRHAVLGDAAAERVVGIALAVTGRTRFGRLSGPGCPRTLASLGDVSVGPVGVGAVPEETAYVSVRSRGQGLCDQAACPAPVLRVPAGECGVSGRPAASYVQDEVSPEAAAAESGGPRRRRYAWSYARSPSRTPRGQAHAKTGRILGELAGGHADHTWEKGMRELIRPDVLVLDDFAMRQLTALRPTASTNSSPSGRGAL